MILENYAILGLFIFLLVIVFAALLCRNIVKKRKNRFEHSHFNLFVA